LNFAGVVVMGDAVQSLATYADIVDLPDNFVGELVMGTLYTQARPAPRHARASSKVGSILDRSFDNGSGNSVGWWILDEPELHLEGDILVPDLAGWRRERMPKLPDTAWFELAPDWVAEVLSPGTARKDRGLKMPIYARWGVVHCWLIDPDARTLEAYANQDGQWVLLGAWGDADQVTVAPFEAVPFDLAGLWAD
jgi:Uma2 family endonuclease